MLEHLGHAEAAADIVRAVERIIVEGPHTPDMKGRSGTAEVGAAVAEAVRAQSRVAA
jgi:tartrate dehydrogenase/decarboxylase/D-malate dehydrogenase